MTIPTISQNILGDKHFEQARLRAAASHHSSDWLNCLPIPANGLKLDDPSMRACVGLRLGTTLCVPHKCTNCGDLVSKYGRHGLSCEKSKGRHSRHKQANDLIRRAMESAGYPAYLEPEGLDKDTQKRPDGRSLIPWTEGKPGAWDFTCCDTLASSYVMKSSKNACQAAEIAENRKITKYEGLNQFVFYPVAVETLGSWGEVSKKFITDIGSRIAAITGEKRSTSFLFQRMSIFFCRVHTVAQPYQDFW